MSSVSHRPVALLLCLLAGLPVQAGVLSASIDSGLFGHLSQWSTDCDWNGCGPAAAVNSFVFLQRQYPLIYDNKLVPMTYPNNPALFELVSVAMTLAGADYMNTECGRDGRGTYWGRFILGKRNYIENQVASKTVYQAFGDFVWNQADAGGAQPGWVTSGKPPSPDFLYKEIQDKEDVEILITNPATGAGHWVTVTGIDWDTDGLDGSLSFVDPWTGADSTANIAQGQAGDRISIDYRGLLQEITVAVSESPVPEPQAWLLLISGTVVLLRMRRRAS
jgi:hypothetical protein